MTGNYTKFTNDFIRSYIENINKQPLLLMFPSKKNIGISICLSMLKEYWLNDIENYDSQINFKKGDILKITLPPIIGIRKNTIVKRIKCEGFINGSVKIIDIDKVATTVSLVHYERYMIADNSNKKLNKFTDFAIARRQLFKSETNPYSSFLKLDYYLNPNRLKSKIYFICGNGLIGNTRNFIEKFKLNNLNLEKESLYIKEDLNDFNNFFLNIDENQNISFSEIVTTILNSFDETFSDEIIDLKIEILSNIENNTINSEQFRKLYNNLIEELEDDNNIRANNSAIALSHQINLLHTSDDLLNNVKFVIINNVKIANENQNTIKKLLNINIPVIILADRALYKKENRENQDLFINNNKECYRLNWNREKLMYLEETIDKDNWDYIPFKLSKRYLNQKIIISKNNRNDEEDRLYSYFEIEGNLKELNGNEQLKKDYYDYLRPVIYWFKNSTGELSLNIPMYINDALNKFQDSFNMVTISLNQTNPNLNNNFKKIIEVFKSFTSNGKILTFGNSFVFNQTFSIFNDEGYNFNINVNNVFDKIYSVEKIVFTGYPYKEYSKSYLNYSIFEKYISNIEILTWCREGQSIENNIRKTIIAAEKISDNLPEGFTKFYKNDEYILHERLLVKGDCKQFDNINDVDDFEINQKDLENNYQYANYSGKETEHLKKVTVIEFAGNKKMFMASNTKILTLKNSGSLENCKWEEIRPYDIVFIFKLTRQMNIDMRPDSDISGNFKKMDLWYEELKKLFVFLNEKTLLLHAKLIEINHTHNLGGNPEIYNIKNWLHKERYINAPDPKNLKLILTAAKIPNIEEMMNSIYKSKKSIEKEDRNNRKIIKIAITKEMKISSEKTPRKFIIQVNGVRITVHQEVVLEKKDPENLMVEVGQIGIIL